MRWQSIGTLPFGRAIALTVAVGVALPAGLASTEARAYAPAAADGKDLDAARKLYDDGKSFFDTSQYEKAADIWTRAYGKVPDDAAGVKNAMVYNIATAQEKAYVMDKDVVHLRQAEQLLRTYVENYKLIYTKTPETKVEVDKANTRIRELQAKIRQAESGVAPTAPAPQPTPAADPHYGSGAVDGIVWSSGSAAEVDQEALAENRRLSSESKKADTLIIAGYVVGSIGLLSLLIAAGGLGTAATTEPSDGSTTTTTTRSRGVGYGSLVVGLAGLAAGGALLGVGFSKRKKIRNREVRISPSFGPSMAGVSFGMRF
ncbi:MAG: hypothetical protein JKY37_30520 [Nannocystaceae bacterium]|nr:hypothetical protein [Nannocystaceae bacterium]